MFGSAFLGAHLMRGAAAAALLAWAIVHQTAHPWLSLGAGCRPRRATRMPDVLDCGLGRDAFARPSRFNDQIVVGMREPAPRCRGWRGTVDEDGQYCLAVTL